MTGAAEQIRIGASQLRTDTSWSADETLDTIGDFHAVLDAVASHTRRLLRPAQIQPLSVDDFLPTPGNRADLLATATGGSSRLESLGHDRGSPMMAMMGRRGPTSAGRPS